MHTTTSSSTSSQITITRKGWLDLLRIFAIVCVVLLHTRQRVPIDIPLSFIIGTGVPVFLIISGGLMLNKAQQMHVNDYFRKYARRMLQFFILIPICGTMTNALAWYCMGTDVTLIQANQTISSPELMRVGEFTWAESLYKSITEANGLYPTALHIGNSHTWYLYLIIGLYIGVPFLSTMCKNITNKQLAFLCTIILLAGLKSIPTVPAFLAPFNNWHIFYFLAGYPIIARHALRKHTIAHNCVLISACLLIIIGKAPPYIHADISALIVQLRAPIFCIALTLVCRDYLNGINHKIIKGLSECSFSIYLWHFSILWLCSIFLPMDGIDYRLKFATYFAASFCIPWLIAILLRRFRLLRWLVC